MTDRQRQIRDALLQGKEARQIAKELGITRNAVYQVLTRLRDLGELPPDFTPTGQPPRSVPPNPSGRAGVLALAQELAYVQGELDRLSRRLSDLLYAES